MAKALRVLLSLSFVFALSLPVVTLTSTEASAHMVSRCYHNRGRQCRYYRKCRWRRGHRYCYRTRNCWRGRRCYNTYHTRRLFGWYTPKHRGGRFRGMHFH